MRIKRFLAPDMRTALRMVRDEQGPDAVILSNRPTAHGIEVVAATDYDESLMSQALRAAAPGIEPLPAPIARAATAAPPAQVVAPATATATVVAPATRSAVTASVSVAGAPVSVHADTQSTGRNIPAQRDPVPVTATPERDEPARESLISRARAIFRIGDAPATADGPTLAELVTPATATTPRPQSAATKPAVPPVVRTLDIRVDDALDIEEAPAAAELVRSVPAGDAERRCQDALEPAAAALAGEPEADFESLIAAFATPAAVSARPATGTATADAQPIGSMTLPSSASDQLASVPSPFAQASDADYLIALSSPAQAPATLTKPEILVPPRTLQIVPVARIETPDPTIIAMREELASMRALMEKQMESLSLERLRGSPARAAVLDALLGFGCDDELAQSIAASIDPRLAGDELQAAMAAQFAHAMPVLRAEPIEDGGVIALVGPTGAGKTTTAAKLAARFAARHRARDVALVSIDRERTGAREQLHAYGRRLGVTVCDAESSDELGQALDQLVDYPLVLVDTTGYGVRDRALLRQILWLRSSSRLRSLLVLPANANPHDLGEIARRYRPAAPQGVVLTKLDETGRAGAALSVLAQQGLPLVYTSAGQQIPQDLQAADAAALTPELASPLEKTIRAAVNPLATEDRHAFA